MNAGELYLGRPAIVSATPRGVMALLEEHQVELDGARAVVIGRSDIVGKPLSHLLQQANATVTLCHSHTRDLQRHTLDADVLVAAVGVPALVTPDMVKTGAVVVDVGMNRTEAGLVGDVDPGAAELASAMTPGAGRRRPDDDRLPAPERRSLRALPPRRPRVSRVVPLIPLRRSAGAGIS